ncbi:MAG TPA: Gfo/Idh/MocA family oxidoreductase [Saprospiraceae bacterium]|nr:Gfo/Idh/MocA family oxidoreductase [Saprospiraceae bacterium]HPG09200.1 Gfo/Idh/MocA family oxidoreductase [Saprospiraceae bacterium]HQU52127.1 Gfo/Idh/MocA family oxidoreductase [Saprospiraceae bacterium]HRV85933.1 Gfo/Idh/MocA family oxidoreductase [Saprospiraceae bacterium]
MKKANPTRRQFIRNTALGAASLSLPLTAKSYRRILGANDRVRVGIVGFSNRCRGALIPAFQNNYRETNFEIVALSDIWNRRREEGAAFLKEKFGNDITLHPNNESLYEANAVDAVIISTADFQHALHATEAAHAGKDAYVEKPFAETMADARVALKAIKEAGIIVQIGSQRRSGANYHRANDYIKSGKFGDIVMVEMTWNVNQPGRWRLPELTASIRESDTDWKRYLLNRPYEAWDPRKYLEYRLFWPYSSGIPGQWMSHQIDTVHWFTGIPHPRSVAANGGIYLWKDGRKNFDTMTAVFDYGPLDNPNKGFQVVYSSRFTNSAGGTKEIYYSNGGELNLDTNKVTPTGGLNKHFADEMGMQANLLEEYDLSSASDAKVETSANTGGDPLTTAHMRNWMDSVRSRTTPNAPVEAGYNHSISNIMTTAALRTGQYVTFDEVNQEVLAGGKVFQY